MSRDPHDPFRLLDPPPGGAERLSRRFDERAPRRPGALPVLAVTATLLAVAVLVAWLAPGRNAEDPPVESTTEVLDAPQFDRLLGRPFQAQLSVTLNERAASVQRIETPNDNIRIYRVAAP